MSGAKASAPVAGAKRAISPGGPAGGMLAVLVTLTAAGAFLVPQQWFLLLNPAHPEIVELDRKRAKLEDDLAKAQEERRGAEQQVLFAQSDIAAHRNALMRSLRQQLANSVIDPFDGPTSPGKMLDDAMSAVRLAGQQPSRALLDTINAARNNLASYARQNKAISGAVQDLDKALKDSDKLQSEFDKLKIRIAGIEEETRVVTARHRAITQQSANQYLAMRAVSLGALGAFTAALAAFLQGAAPRAPLQRGLTMLSMVFGGIVALVVFALFTTRELSVFAHHGAAPDEMPDYWRVVIVCLIAGAFADRLFAAAREHVYQATQGRDQADG